MGRVRNAKAIQLSRKAGPRRHRGVWPTPVRTRVIFMHESLHRPIPEIIQETGVSQSTVYRWLSKDVLSCRRSLSKRQFTGRPRKLTPDMVDQIINTLQQGKWKTRALEWD